MSLIEVIKIIKQFGLRRLLFLRNYLKWIVGSVYQEGSLRNVDQDKDGIPDAFTFSLKNPVVAAHYKAFRLEVDGQEMRPIDIEIVVDGEKFSSTGISFHTPLTLLPGQPQQVMVHKQGGLKRGKHRLKITLELRNATILWLTGEAVEEAK